MAKRIVVFSGAGISVESGIPTFRDHGGFWEGLDPARLASAWAWENNRAEVLDFYNRRRAQLRNAEPNEAHRLLARLEEMYDVTVITQNVDDLHERAGSTHVLHLHGELTWARPEDTYNWDDCFSEADLVYIGYEPIRLGDTGGENRAQLRPHIVFFGEPVPKMLQAALAVRSADILLVVGTSLQVEPAASLLEEAPAGCEIYVIDPADIHRPENAAVHRIKEKATTGVRQFTAMLGYEPHQPEGITKIDYYRLVTGYELCKTKVGRHVEFDNDGHCVKEEWAGGCVTTHRYDLHGLEYETRVRFPSGNTTLTRYERDDDGEIIRQQDYSHEKDTAPSGTVDYIWQRHVRKMRMEGRARYHYYRKDGLLKHVISGDVDTGDQYFYKYYRDKKLKSRVVKTYMGGCQRRYYEVFNHNGTKARETNPYADGEITYLYAWDEHGNWIRRTGYDTGGKLFSLEERIITYGKTRFSFDDYDEGYKHLI